MEQTISRAKDALRAAINEHGGFDVVAGELGCTREHLYQLCSHLSRKRPGAEISYGLHRLLKIDMHPFGAPFQKTRGRRKGLAAQCR